MRKRILVFGVIASSLLLAAPRATVVNFHNYPNPFRAVDAKTTFKVTLSSAVLSKVAISVYNPQGKVLFSDQSVSNAGANPYTFDWRGVDDKGAILAPGLYHAKVEVRTTDGDLITAYTKVVVK